MQQVNNDIYYLVRLKGDGKIQDSLYYKSTIKDQFCGKLVNQTGRNLYFELNESGALVIIPHDWVDWMAPSKVLWEQRIKQKNVEEETKLEKLIAYIESALEYASNPEKCFFYKTNAERIARVQGVADIIDFIENAIKE